MNKVLLFTYAILSILLGTYFVRKKGKKFSIFIPQTFTQAWPYCLYICCCLLKANFFTSAFYPETGLQMI